MAETLTAVFAASAEDAAVTTAATTATTATASSLGGSVALAAADAATPSLFASVGSFVASNAALLSGGFSVLTGLMSAKSQATTGQANAFALQSQAKQLELQADQETTRGVQESNIIKQRTLNALASNTARTAGSGIDINSGTPQNLQQEILRQSDQQLSISRANSTFANLSDQISADNKTIDSGYALDAASSRVGATLFQTAASTFNRGTPSLLLNS